MTIDSRHGLAINVCSFAFGTVKSLLRVPNVTTHHQVYATNYTEWDKNCTPIFFTLMTITASYGIIHTVGLRVILYDSVITSALKELKVKTQTNCKDPIRGRTDRFSNIFPPVTGNFDPWPWPSNINGVKIKQYAKCL